MRSWSSSAACAGVAGLSLVLAAACAQSPSSPSPSSAVAGSAAATAGGGNAAKVDVCHVVGNGGIVRISVAASAVSAHLGHGDAVDPDFSGGWAEGQVTLTDAGEQVTGVFNFVSRPPFYGTVPNGGCANTIDMTFPDDNTYRGTLVNACFIQWSYPGDLTSTDPANYWTKDSCN